jgi:DNA-binding PadR family transcriptional regulator
MNDPTLLVLASLAEGDKHGYAILTDVKTFADVELGAGTLYAAISRLENRGFIKALPVEDRRRPYRLTPLGRQQLKDQLAALAPVMRVGLHRLKQS